MMMASPTLVVDLRNSTQEDNLGFRGEHSDPTTTTPPLKLSTTKNKRKTGSSTAHKNNSSKASQGGTSRLEPLELLLLVIGESSQSGQQAIPSTTLENSVSGFETPIMATTGRHHGLADEEEDTKQSRINVLRKRRSSRPSTSSITDNNNNNTNGKRSQGPTHPVAQGETRSRESSEKQRSTMLKTNNDTVMPQQHQTSTSRNHEEEAAVASLPTPSKRRVENQRVRSQSTDAQKQPRAPLSPAILSSPQKLRSGRKPVQRSSRVTKTTPPSWDASNLTFSSSFQMMEDSSQVWQSIPSVPASSVLTPHQQYHHPTPSTPRTSGTRKDSVATDVPRRSRSNEPAGQPSYEERPNHNSSGVSLLALSDDANEIIREIPEVNATVFPSEPLEDIATQPSSEPTSTKTKSRRQSLLLSPKNQMKNIASMVAQTSKIIRFKTGGSGTKKLWDSLHDSESWDLSVISNGGVEPTASPVARETKHEVQDPWSSPSPQFDLNFDAPEENPSNAIQSMSLSAPSLEIDEFPESPPSLMVQSKMSAFHEPEQVVDDSPGKESQRRKSRGGRSRRSRSRSKSKDKKRSASAPSGHEGRRSRHAKRRDNDQARETSSRNECRSSAAEQHARSRSLSLAGESGSAKTGESRSRQVRRSEKDVQKSKDGTDPVAHQHHHGKGSSSTRHGVRTRTRLPTENSGRNRDRGLLSPPPGNHGGLNARRREGLLKVRSARTLTKGLDGTSDVDEHDQTSHTTPVVSISSGLVSRRREGLLKVRSARTLREGSGLLDGTTAADEQDRSQRTSRTAGSAATSYGGTVARRRESMLRVRSSRALKDEMKLLDGIAEDEINGSHRTSNTAMSGLSKTTRRELHAGPHDLHQHDSSLNMDSSLNSRKDSGYSLDPTSLGGNKYDPVAEASVRGVVKQAKMKKKKDEAGKPQESSFSLEMSGSIKMEDMIW